MDKPPRHTPLSVWLLGVPAVLCFIGAVLVALELGGTIHPLLTDPATALALVVSGIAFALSAGFPLVIARLRDAEAASRQGSDR